jgi:hypothetical protein
MIKLIIILFMIPIFSESIYVETIRGEKIELNSGEETHFYIFLHGWSCKECFYKLDTALDKVNVEKEVGVIIRSPKNDIISKKEFRKYAYQYYNKRKYTFYFDIHSEKDPIPPTNLKEGLFDIYNIEKTPCLLIISNGLIQYLSYTTLFKKNPSVPELTTIILSKLKEM